MSKAEKTAKLSLDLPAASPAKQEEEEETDFTDLVQVNKENGVVQDNEVLESKLTDIVNSDELENGWTTNRTTAINRIFSVRNLCIVTALQVLPNG